jgi:hypothetical protein
MDALAPLRDNSEFGGAGHGRSRGLTGSDPRLRDNGRQPLAETDGHG